MARSPIAMAAPEPVRPNCSSTPSELQQEVAVQAGMLAACGPDIEALTRADGLRDVIAQIESGQVQAIRDKYGPQPKRDKYGPQPKHPADPMWPKIKVAVTRRERLYALFKKEFGGNKEHFFDFFSKKQRKGNRSCSLEAFRAIVEAIPHMEMDLRAEMERPDYEDSAGSFSEAMWANKWKGRNKMEIWRAIGKESYGARKH